MDKMLEISIKAEAHRYCDEHGIRDHEAFQRVAHSMRHRAFMEAIEPYTKQKVHIAALRLVDRITIGPDGKMETHYRPLSPEAEQALKLIDEAIAGEAERFGLSFPDSGD